MIRLAPDRPLGARAGTGPRIVVVGLVEIFGGGRERLALW
jgi:hypothetical protein